jgi:oxepin-CoA hydrolase/3-oxo-5,6-dehydrosuberyl-CoA semialdehyde dehydrogenase
VIIKKEEMMAVQEICSFSAGKWIGCDDEARPIFSAITGDLIARVGNSTLDIDVMLDFARTVGGPSLRAMTFHDRARLIKAIALVLKEKKQLLYDISFSTGATQKDHLIDIDGGIGTLFSFASIGRREMPDDQIYLDGSVERLSRNGTFLGQHVCTSLQGVAVHINAFNFPVWGMLEKLGPALLAGVPAIVKPATATCHVTELCVRIIIESGILPKGALQLVCGGIGDTLSRLISQDVVSFTGSASTAIHLRSQPHLIENSIRFIAEQDSLNASILGPDTALDSPEFDLFAEEVKREMITKAGQKCTAIRRIFVSQVHLNQMIETLKKQLASISVGDPRLSETDMGALVSNVQKRDVLEKVSLIGRQADRVFGDPDNFDVIGTEVDNGAFVPPLLFYCSDPDTAVNVHDTEVFGPVSTIMAYRDIDHAIELANRGQGSLVASVITNDPEVARQAVLGAGAFHGRLYFNNRKSMQESTGHGSPMPQMLHGGPGRAGGGEELGGIRGVLNYMQRTAVQGSPDILTQISKKWVPGAGQTFKPDHPFTRTFGALEIGETLETKSRKISADDIEHFAHFTGDTFYAHMDEAAAKRNPFFPGRVAHGYLLLSFAAGLFVQPDEGPVLANTGLDNLRFMKPVQAGDSIKVCLTVKHKTPRNESYGEVRWHVSLSNQDNALLAEYELLTMNAYMQSAST